MAQEKRTGKLIDFKEKLKNGVQDTWERKDSKTGLTQKFFIFNVAFDNGDIGEAMATKGIPNWTIGETYNYVLESREYNGKTFYSVRGMSRTSFKKGAAYTAKTAEEWRSHAMQVAIRCTALLYQNNKTLSLKKEHANAITTKNYDWIIKTVGDDDTLYWRAFSVLESAILFYTSSHYEELHKLEQIFDLATDSFIKCTL
jgi:hypothetical protein